MKNIQVRVLNPEAIVDAEKTMVAMARLTQRAEKIGNMEDFIALLNKPYTETTVENMTALPHPTIQKFGVINIAIVGASRRFLAQITRHQNEVKFMSGSLQYSDYSGAAQFVVPYAITKMDAEKPILGPYDQHYPDYWTAQYLKSCEQAFAEYEAAIKAGLDNDAAGYMMPQGLRNVLLISATPFQWKHMIGQRICNRNTLETQYVMLKCWEELDTLSVMFNGIGPSCIQHSSCNEGKMSCKHFLYDAAVSDYMQQHDCGLPTAILDTKFELIREDTK
jgi:thymidylate synthase (FAD)